MLFSFHKSLGTPKLVHVPCITDCESGCVLQSASRKSSITFDYFI